MNTPMKMTAPRGEHLALRAELVALLQRHGDKMTAADMLAVVSHLVGQIVAVQDQTTITPAIAMDIVSRNLQAGNREVVEGLLNAPGGNA